MVNTMPFFQIVMTSTVQGGKERKRQSQNIKLTSLAFFLENAFFRLAISPSGMSTTMDFFVDNLKLLHQGYYF